MIGISHQRQLDHQLTTIGCQILGWRTAGSFEAPIDTPPITTTIFDQANPDLQIRPAYEHGSEICTSNLPTNRRVANSEGYRRAPADSLYHLE